MINVVRVDHRLVHGQVIYSWVGTQDINTIFVVNDLLIDDEIMKNSIRLAKPRDTKLVMMNVENAIEAINSGKTDKYKMMIILGNISDAYKLIKNTNAEITSLNLGGTTRSENTKKIFNQVYVTEDDIVKLDELVDLGVEVEARMVPREDKRIYKKNKGGL